MGHLAIRVTEAADGETFAWDLNSAAAQPVNASSLAGIAAPEGPLRGLSIADLLPCAHAVCGGRDMTRFLAGRLLNYVVLLALASFLTFALASWSFNPLDSLEGRNPRPPQAVIDAKTAELDLDKPIPDAVRALGVRRGARRLRHHHRRPTGVRRTVAAHRRQPAPGVHRLGDRHG